jgi:hypothetical protein
VSYLETCIKGEESMKRSFLFASLFAFAGCPEPIDPPETPIDGPLFVVSTQVFSAEGVTSFVGVVPSLDEGTFDLTTSLEFPGNAVVSGPALQDAAFVADGEEPTVRRLRLSPGGNLVEDAQVSFAGLGVTDLVSFASAFQYISDTKAYFFDTDTAQIVVWNPTAMTVTGSISLAEAVIPDTTLGFEIDPERRGNEIVMSVAYFPIEDPLSIVAETQVLFIDTTTDEVVVSTFSGCGDVLNSILTPDGDLFLSTEGFGVAANRAGGNAPAPCLLRIPSGSRTIENALPGSLNDILGTATGSLTAGANGETFVLALDESLITDPAVFEDALALRGSPAWLWRPIDLENLTIGEPVVGLPPSVASTISMNIGGLTYVLFISNDFSSTTLTQLSTSNIIFGLEVAGVPFGIMQAR